MSKEEYANTVTAFYNLITEFCERGWGRSIHFALMEPGVSFEESIANHEYFLGEAIGLRPGIEGAGCRVRRGRTPTLARKKVRRFDHGPKHQRVSAREVLCV